MTTPQSKPYESFYTDDDFLRLEKALARSENVGLATPDQYQYHQNQLSKEIARFLLKPLYEKRKQQEEVKPKEKKKKEKT